MRDEKRVDPVRSCPFRSPNLNTNPSTDGCTKRSITNINTNTNTTKDSTNPVQVEYVNGIPFITSSSLELLQQLQCGSSGISSGSGSGIGISSSGISSGSSGISRSVPLSSPQTLLSPTAQEISLNQEQEVGRESINSVLLPLESKQQPGSLEQVSSPSSKKLKADKTKTNTKDKDKGTSKPKEKQNFRQQQTTTPKRIPIKIPQGGKRKESATATVTATATATATKKDITEPVFKKRKSKNSHPRTLKAAADSSNHTPESAASSNGRELLPQSPDHPVHYVMVQ